MKKIHIKNKSGVTIIALVITIVVLLILAGISIMAITGENGLINQSIKAKQESDLSDAKNEVIQEWYNLQEETRKLNLNNNRMAELLQERLQVGDELASVSYKTQNETFEVHYKGYIFEIGEEGQITNK